MLKDKKQLSLDEAADSILKEIAAHAQTLSPNERKVRIDAFGKALAKGVKSYRPKQQPTFGTRASRLSLRKRG